MKKTLICLAALAAAAAVRAQIPVPVPPHSINVQIVTSAPPPPREEIRVAAPTGSGVWTPGYWDWRGQWVWVEGSWSRPPAPQAQWVRAEYVPAGGGYRYVPAHWSTERVVEVQSERHDNGKHKGWYKEKKHKHHKHDDY